MKILFLMIFFAGVLSGYAQPHSFQNDRNAQSPNRFYEDTLVRKKLLEERLKRDKANGVFRLPKNITPLPTEKQLKEGDMPVVKFKSSSKYLGNNGKGDDIYAMAPDNMPCLVADSTFKSRMPVKGSKIKMVEKQDVKPEED